MDEIIPGLWIGDLPSALDTNTLKANGIFSILTAMRGRITIHETFIRHQILLDDTEDEDVLIHLLPSITFIQAELDKGRGVLVHCQAGMSRSATIVAAYLMYTLKIDVEQALDLIRKTRPDTQPNDGFMTQLEVFHQASFKISRSNKPTRMYYLARTVEEVMNGDGSLPDSSSMFAKFPNTPNDSQPTTPAPIVRRRIRCKMCRQELATREHMLDHGQLNPPTPAILSHASSPIPSRRGSSALSGRPLISKSTTPTPSGSTDAVPTSTTPTPATTSPENAADSTTTSLSRSHSSSAAHPRSRMNSASSSRPRRPSNLGLSGIGESLAMSSIVDTRNQDQSDDTPPTSSSTNPSAIVRSYSAGAKDIVKIDEYSSGSDAESKPGLDGTAPLSAKNVARFDSAIDSDDSDDEAMGVRREYEVEAARLLGRRMSNILRGGMQADAPQPPSVHSASDTQDTLVLATPTQEIPEPQMGSTATTTHRKASSGRAQRPHLTHLPAASPIQTTTLSRVPTVNDLPAPVPLTHAQSKSEPQSSTAEVAPPLERSSGSSGYMTPQDLTAQLFANPKLAALRSGGMVSPPALPSHVSPTSTAASSLPIIANPKCSGYFLEPMKWMEPFLQDGQLAGKILCPNKKCNAKLGNYDWAGVCCSCKEWVTPGFCIARSKVDEVV